MLIEASLYLGDNKIVPFVVGGTAMDIDPAALDGVIFRTGLPLRKPRTSIRSWLQIDSVYHHPPLVGFETNGTMIVMPQDSRYIYKIPRGYAIGLDGTKQHDHALSIPLTKVGERQTQRSVSARFLARWCDNREKGKKNQEDVSSLEQYYEEAKRFAEEHSRDIPADSGPEHQGE